MEDHGGDDRIPSRGGSAPPWLRREWDACRLVDDQGGVVVAIVDGGARTVDAGDHWMRLVRARLYVPVEDQEPQVRLGSAEERPREPLGEAGVAAIGDRCGSVPCGHGLVVRAKEDGACGIPRRGRRRGVRRWRGGGRRRERGGCAA